MNVHTTPLALVVGADGADAFLRSRAQELVELDFLSAPVALRLTYRRVLRGEALVLAAPGQVWTRRASADPDDAPIHRLAIRDRLTEPPRVLATDLDDPTGEVDEFLIEFLDSYQLATWHHHAPTAEGAP